MDTALANVVPKLRQGGYVTTYTGREFWPLDPHPEDVDIRDIAHHLSLTCRFGGACRRFYSVAQHSLMVESLMVSDGPGGASIALQALLHDAAEAYCGDMVRPVKRCLPAYKELEERIWRAIQIKFNLESNSTFQAIIKVADEQALAIEQRDLFHGTAKDWALPEPVAEVRCAMLTPQQAEIQFLERFDEIQALIRAGVR